MIKQKSKSQFLKCSANFGCPGAKDGIGRSFISRRKNKILTRLFIPRRIEEITMPSFIPSIDDNTGINISEPPKPQEADTRNERKIMIAMKIVIL